MRFAKKNTGRNIARNSGKFRRREETADDKIYRAVKVATGAITIGIMAAVGIVAATDKKENKPAAETVLCEDIMKSKDGKNGELPPDCVDAKTNGNHDKAKTVSNSSD